MLRGHDEEMVRGIVEFRKAIEPFLWGNGTCEGDMLEILHGIPPEDPGLNL
jgi:hypothetical protein